jgi:hypothetical protein
MPHDLWLHCPDSIDQGEVDAEMAHLWQLARSSSGLFYVESPVPTWKFLCWLVERRNLLLHGTSDPGIGLFEPRRPKDGSVDEFSKQTAVFAASDGIWPIFYAVLDRSTPGVHILNAALRFESQGRLSPVHYFFSVAARALRDNPWTEGVVYVLPRQGFVQQPPYRMGGRTVHEPHWACPWPVQPLAKIRVLPLDFPFLDQVRGHDEARIAEQSAVDPDGFPWIASGSSDL